MASSGTVKINSLTALPEELGELEEEFVLGEIIGVFVTGWGVDSDGAVLIARRSLVRYTWERACPW